jgi:hypothetical protein
MMPRKLWLLISILYLLFVFTGCGLSRPPMSSGTATMPTTAEQERPGLATQWGETRTSPVTNTSFTRANPNTPTATAVLYYNDQAGVERMAGWSNYQRLPAAFYSVGEGLVSFGIRDESGNLLEGLIANDNRYVIGETGRRYSIVVRNDTGNRLEAVISVDGLDVLDGKPAAVTKSGYVIAPYSTLQVDGFRQSLATVAAFRFGAVQDSYTNRKYGDTRNVGVIGLAIFHESGSNPSSWTDNETRQRRSAEPFPGRFATPPE